MTDTKRIDIFGHVALIVLAAAFSVAVSRYVAQPFLASQRNIREFRDAVVILSKADGDLERLDHELKRVEAEIAASEAMVPAEINVDAFLDQVGGIAADEGIRVERLAPSRIRQYRLFRELVLDVQVKGPFLSIAEFLNKLEGGERISRVSRITITPDRDGDDCSAKISLALYFAPQMEA